MFHFFLNKISHDSKIEWLTLRKDRFILKRKLKSKQSYIINVLSKTIWNHTITIIIHYGRTYNL